MCKDMKKIPNSPPNRRPNSPRTPKKARRSAKKSTSQRVNRATGLRSTSFFEGRGANRAYQTPTR